MNTLGDDEDDDWGEFDQYEDPNDVAFPTTLPKTNQPDLSITESEVINDSKKDSTNKAPEQQFPKVNNLEDLMSLMQTSAQSAPTANNTAANKLPAVDLLNTVNHSHQIDTQKTN